METVALQPAGGAQNMMFEYCRKQKLLLFFVNQVLYENIWFLAKRLKAFGRALGNTDMRIPNIISRRIGGVNESKEDFGMVARISGSGFRRDQFRMQNSNSIYFLWISGMNLHCSHFLATAMQENIHHFSWVQNRIPNYDQAAAIC